MSCAPYLGLNEHCSATAVTRTEIRSRSSAHAPRPTDRDSWVLGQAAWLHDAYTLSLGPTGRVDLEAKVGGNPSTTVGVDYARQLAHSDDTDLVREAYHAARLDLRADLAALNAEPRIAADPAARVTMATHRPQGSAPSPVLTLHTTGDGGAPPAQERSFADQVRRTGDPSELRSVYVERGAHLSQSAAEEIVAIQTLLPKVNTGHWPLLDPYHLNRGAQSLGSDYFLVLDLVTFMDAPHDPAFVHFHAPLACPGDSPALLRRAWPRNGRPVWAAGIARPMEEERGPCREWCGPLEAE
jgi:hypothetical protein